MIFFVLRASLYCRKLQIPTVAGHICPLVLPVGQSPTLDTACWPRCVVPCSAVTPHIVPVRPPPRAVTRQAFSVLCPLPCHQFSQSTHPLPCFCAACSFLFAVPFLVANLADPLVPVRCPPCFFGAGSPGVTPSIVSCLTGALPPLALLYGTTSRGNLALIF